MLKLLLLFLASITFLSCASVRTVEKKPTLSQSYLARKGGIYYSVRKGDSLWRISRRYGISIAEIMRENNTVSARDLKIGQKLFIPYREKDSRAFIWPAEGEVVNSFGESVDNAINRGLNIKTVPSNNKVRLAASGVVVFSNYLKGWGKTVIVKHDSNFYTIYANLEESLLQEGKSSRQGEIVGKVASAKDGTHVLHFEIRKKYIPQNPLKYLN